MTNIEFGRVHGDLHFLSSRLSHNDVLLLLGDGHDSLELLGNGNLKEKNLPIVWPSRFTLINQRSLRSWDIASYLSGNELK